MGSQEQVSVERNRKEVVGTMIFYDAMPLSKVCFSRLSLISATRATA